MPTHSPHCPCYHCVPSMLQTAVNFASTSRDQLSQAPLVQPCLGPGAARHSPAAAGLHSPPDNQAMQSCRDNALSCFVRTGMWWLWIFLPSGQSLHLLHLPWLPFVLCPTPSGPAFLGVSALAASTLRMEIIPSSAEAKPTHLSVLTATRSYLDQITGFFSSFSILEHLILYH